MRSGALTSAIIGVSEEGFWVDRYGVLGAIEKAATAGSTQESAIFMSADSNLRTSFDHVKGFNFSSVTCYTGTGNTCSVRKKVVLDYLYL